MKEFSLYGEKTVLANGARVLSYTMPHIRSVSIILSYGIGSRFEAEELEKERGVIIEEIRATQDDPTDLAGELLNKIVWEEQPVGRPIAGSEETVGGLDRAALLDYFAAHYNAANLVISVAGNVPHDEVVRR